MLKDASRARSLAFHAGAASVLRPRVHAVFACEAATRAGDPDAGIHDMRVAAKRLREALRLFAPAFRKKDAKRHLRWVGEINAALGEVRDVDVLEKRLTKRAAKLGAPAGLDDLLARLARRRDGGRSWLVFLLDRVQERMLAAKLEATLVRVAAERTADEPTLERFAVDAILTRLAKVRRRWERVRLDGREESFHRVRIANKHLRYAIEPFVDFLPPAVKDAGRVARRFHDALGDLHDEDVFLHAVETEICCAKPGDRPAWERFARDAQTRRRRYFARTLALADTLMATGWRTLEDALRADAEIAAAEPGADATRH